MGHSESRFPDPPGGSYQSVGNMGSGDGGPAKPKAPQFEVRGGAAGRRARNDKGGSKTKASKPKAASGAGRRKR